MVAAACLVIVVLFSFAASPLETAQDSKQQQLTEDRRVVSQTSAERQIELSSLRETNSSIVPVRVPLVEELGPNQNSRDTASDDDLQHSILGRRLAAISDLNSKLSDASPGTSREFDIAYQLSLMSALAIQDTRGTFRDGFGRPMRMPKNSPGYWYVYGEGREYRLAEAEYPSLAELVSQRRLYHERTGEQVQAEPILSAEQRAAAEQLYNDAIDAISATASK